MSTHDLGHLQRALLWAVVAILMGTLAWALAHGLDEPEAPESPPAGSVVER